MPIYEYQCSNCNHHLEVLQKITDEPLTECPQCKQSDLQKLVSAAGFQLKGSGWYVTDYSKKGKAKTSADEASTSSTTTKDKPQDGQSSQSASSSNSGETNSKKSEEK